MSRREELYESIERMERQLQEAREELNRLDDADRAPSGWGYIRVSTRRQREDGSSVASQVQRIVEYAEKEGIDLGPERTVAVEGGAIAVPEQICIDAASAYKKDFRHRPGGREACKQMRSGDVLLVASFDRAFRSIRDCFSQLDRWNKQGVRIVFIDRDIDISTSTGRMILAVFGAVAEMESSIRADRAREGHRFRWAQGRPMGNWCPKGFRWEGKGAHKRLVPWEMERALMRQLYEWHCQGYSYASIVELSRRYGLSAPRRNARQRCRHGHEFHTSTVQRYIKAEEELREIEQSIGEALHDHAAGRTVLDEMMRREQERRNARKRSA